MLALGRLLRLESAPVLRPVLRLEVQQVAARVRNLLLELSYWREGLVWRSFWLAASGCCQHPWQNDHGLLCALGN